MTILTLGRLEKVLLRDVWRRESEDFTPWLAQEDNLAALGETVGINLAFEAREKPVGPFRADILCKDTANDTYVLIENQLESTDHGHLGQLLTYAAGLEAVTIIWIAESFSEEHRAAVDWLNRITGEKFNFFGLEIELWRIADSPAAPKFNVVCKPNNWSRSVMQAAQGDITDTKQKQLVFWTAFAEYLKKYPKSLQAIQPLPQTWMNFFIGRSGFNLAAIASTWNNSSADYAIPELRVELAIHGPNAKQDFARLIERREEIEQKIDVPLVWHNAESTRRCKIYTRIDGDFRDQTQWLAQHEWLRKYLDQFNRVFTPIVKAL